MEDRIRMKTFFEGEPNTEEEKLGIKLSEKLTKEYNDFIENLVNQSPTDIVDRAYEKVCKEEIVYCFEKQVLSISDYKALLKCPNILEDCYDEWLKTDANFNEVLEFAVENSIEHIKEDYKKELKSKNKEAR